MTLMPVELRAASVEQSAYPAAVPGASIVFPRDFGAHPAFRTEWWYVTGWLQQEDGRPVGVQVTFFRHRPHIGEGSASRFAPSQLLFAHAAIADPLVGRLQHDQRSARAGFGLAQAAEGITDVRIGDWSLNRDNDVYLAHIAARTFRLDLAFAATQPPILQGEAGYSRKGPLPSQASYYTSEAQLRVTGTLTHEGRTGAVTGTAWCDHEWSSEALAPEAVGWDWTGINIDDGAAMMAFVMRHRAGGVLWAGGVLRAVDHSMHVFDHRDVQFVPQRFWRSPRTQVSYPVAMKVNAGGRAYTLEPLMDDQELDARGSTGTIYWEGAVKASVEGRAAGRGYLELTGYGQPMRL